MAVFSICQAGDGGADQSGVIDTDDLSIDLPFVLKVLFKIELDAGFEIF